MVPDVCRLVAVGAPAEQGRRRQGQGVTPDGDYEVERGPVCQVAGTEWAAYDHVPLEGQNHQRRYGTNT